jgi:hypothetical protein
MVGKEYPRWKHYETEDYRGQSETSIHCTGCKLYRESEADTQAVRYWACDGNSFRIGVLIANFALPNA